MNCPEHLIFKTTNVRVWHIQSADIPRSYVSWWEVVNPLRYELQVDRRNARGVWFRINEDARWHRKFSDALFRLRRRFGLS